MSSNSSRAHVAVFGSVIPGSIAVPVPLSVTPLMCSFVSIVASRGRAVNVGSVFLGSSAVNDTQNYPLIPGQSIQFWNDDDNLIDLSQIYVDSVTVTDGVQFMALTPPNQ